MKRFVTFFKFAFIGLAMALFGLAAARSQSVDDLLTTTALTTTGTDGQPWAYVVWDAPSGIPLSGRLFSVNVKLGLPAATGTFVRRALVTSQVTGTEQPPPSPPSPILAASFLTIGKCLGEDLTSLDGLLADALRGLSNPAPPIPPSRAERLSALITRNEAGTQQVVIPTLRRLSPSVALAVGQAWAGPLTVQNGQNITIEIREVDAATQADRGVVGRVSFPAGSMTPLPASGAPVQVPDVTATGDLNLQMRWSMPPALLRMQAQLQGFHVYRVQKALALSNNWQTTAPTAAQLIAAAAASPTLVKRRTQMPMRELKVFSATDVSNFVADPSTYFYGDDNDRYRQNGVTFNDGDEFLVFTVAYDLLGRPGGVSPAGPGLVCRLIPPPTPREVVVVDRTNNVAAGSAAGASELHITWTPNVDTALETTQQYQVFVSDNPSSFAANPTAGTPVPTLLGTLSAVGATPGEFSYTPAAADPKGITRWYSVRAVHIGARGPIYSAYAPAAPGAQRIFTPATAPASAQTFSASFCARTALLKTGVTNLARNGTPPGQVLITVTNENSELAWLEVVHLDDGQAAQRIFFPPAPTGLTYQFTATNPSAPFAPALAPRYNLALTAYSKGGVRSRTITLVTETSPTSAQSVVINLRASVLGAAQITSTDVLAATVLNASAISSVAVPIPLLSDPTLGSSTLAGNGGDYLVEASVNAAAFGRVDVTSRWQNTIIFHPYSGTGTARYRVTPILGDSAACSAGFHHSRQPGSTKINPVVVGFSAPVGMAEFRLYREVDTGGLTMIKHGELTVPAGTVLAVSDFGLPPVAACLNYFVQTFDKDGNSSPMQRLGNCVLSVVPLEAPVMGAPEFSGTIAAPKVKLHWTSATAGVERFEIAADPDNGAVDEPNDAGDIFHITHKAPRSTLPTVAEADTRAGIPTMRAGKFTRKDKSTGLNESKSFAHGAAFLTPMIGSGRTSLGQGPLFTQEFSITAGVEYHFSVAALGASSGAVRARSDYSAAVAFRWSPPPPPPTVECVLPWPARDLPPVTTFHPDIVAHRFVPGVGDTVPGGSDLDGLVQNERPIWPRDHEAHPVGVRIGRLVTNTSTAAGVLSGFSTTDPTDDFLDLIPAGFADSSLGNLNNILFTGAATAQAPGQNLFPVVLYRQQVANAAFPVVPDTVVQCSPKLNTIAYENLSDGNRRLRDPYIGMTAPAEFNPSSLPIIWWRPDNIESITLNFYLLDTKPVLNGARYHYFLMRFTPEGEIGEIIDAGEVELPNF
jgi:hypothetical protein